MAVPAHATLLGPQGRLGLEPTDEVRARHHPEGMSTAATAATAVARRVPQPGSPAHTRWNDGFYSPPPSGAQRSRSRRRPCLEEKHQLASGQGLPGEQVDLLHPLDGLAARGDAELAVDR